MIASSTEAREYVLVKAAELVQITGEPADPWIIAENIAHELLEQKKELQGLEENSSAASASAAVKKGQSEGT
jgi:hypothetical protein